MGVDISFTDNFKEAMSKLDLTGRERMVVAIEEVKGFTMEEMTKSKGGRTYTHYFYTDANGKLRRGRKRWKPHTASAPGAFPARDTGELIQHLLTEVSGEGGKTIGRFGTDRKYGPMLEFGTKKMAARPWLRPSFERKQKDIEAIFMRQWF